MRRKNTNRLVSCQDQLALANAKEATQVVPTGWYGEGSMSGKAYATRQQILKAARQLVIERGYAGTSLDDILSVTKLTKGAFFYHFKGKSDLARTLIDQYAKDDGRFFLDLSRRADEQSQEPLQNVLIFLHLFEEYLTQRPKYLRSCMYAAYSHEFGQFEVEIVKAVRTGIAQWKAIYRDKFERVLGACEPRYPVTADDLACMVVSLIEGSLILARIEGDPRLVVRQSEQFRGFLKLLFAQ